MNTQLHFYFSILLCSIFLLSTSWLSAQNAIEYDVDRFGKSFNPVTVINNPNVETLPLELASFNGVSKGCLNILNWNTEVEVSTSYFEILYSTNGQQFTVLDAIPAAGTSTQLNHYSFSQPTVFSRTYYKLRTVDIDGSTHESKAIVINAKCKVLLNEFSLYPNPSNKDINLSFSADLDLNIELTVTNAFGRMVMNKQVEVSSGTNTIELPTDQLTAGVYYLHVNGADIAPQRFLKAN